MHDNRAAGSLRAVRLLAAVTGLVGFLLAVAAPLLPVRQVHATVNWPQAGTVNIDAPLMSYQPEQLSLTVPCSALRSDTGTLVSTIPATAPEALAKGLVVSISGNRLSVIQRNVPLLSTPLAELGNCSALHLTSTASQTTATLQGAHRLDGSAWETRVDRDIRPQVVGVFSDLNSQQIAGMHLQAPVDSRFSSSPSLLKYLVIAGAVLCTAVALVALHRLDIADGRRGRRFLPEHWWRFRLVDGVMLGTLALWHVIGANTSDDGYILTMARVNGHAGYMANYYRWFGVPEAPFGWSYEVLSWMTRISTASLWMRLPALLAGVVCWLAISREVLPRLGVRVRTSSVAAWTAGLVFLAFWLPYDNGLRPEPLIAAGALLTWCAIERAIATARLLPAAVAVLIAAFSLGAGPTGLICIAALIAGSRPILGVIVKKAEGPREGRWLRYLAVLAPGMAAGVLVLVVVFADQTLGTVMEATRVRTIVGPNAPWFDERTRWDSLFLMSPDGSIGRRFAVLVMLVCLLVCILQVLRKRRIPGTAQGPSVRVLGIVFASLFLMMFTPTKWTHHFGVYAGLGGSLAALAAVAVGTNGIRAPRNRALLSAAMLFLLAVTFTGPNGWWYVSSYGVPFWDKAPMVGGKGLSTIFLVLSGVALIVALWLHYRDGLHPDLDRPLSRSSRWASAPLTLAATILVVFEVGSMAKAAITQYPAYSVTLGNARALAGDPCGMANSVLIETNTADSLLQPYQGSIADGLDSGNQEENRNFTPNGIPGDLTADSETTVSGTANSPKTDTPNKTSKTTAAGTGGGISDNPGVNGSTAKLPYGLDPAKTPVMGSYQREETQHQAHLVSQWYRFPVTEQMRSDPAYQVLVISAAGRIKSTNRDGVTKYGQDLKVEYGVRGQDGTFTTLGSVAPLDIGPDPSWRNLRVPLDKIPPQVNAVRLVASDEDINQKQWLALTPPRLPRLATLNSVVGQRDPVLLDWHVGLAFGCQRPFDHRYGVAEVPKWRILPDRVGADASNGVQDDIGGGPLGFTELLLDAQTVPGYLAHDWERDWGELEHFLPYAPDSSPAQLAVQTRTRSGLEQGTPIRVN